MGKIESFVLVTEEYGSLFYEGFFMLGNVVILN